MSAAENSQQQDAQEAEKLAWDGTMCAKRPSTAEEKKDMDALAVHNMLTAARYGNIPDVTMAVCLWLSQHPGSTLVDLERFLRANKHPLGVIADVKGSLCESLPEAYSYYSLTPPFQQVDFSIIFSMRPDPWVAKEREEVQGMTTEENEAALLKCGVAVADEQVDSEKLMKADQKILFSSPGAMGELKIVAVEQPELQHSLETQMGAGLAYAKMVHKSLHPDRPEPKMQTVLVGMAPDRSHVMMLSIDGSTPLMVPGPDNKLHPCSLGLMLGYAKTGRQQQMVVSMTDRGTWCGFVHHDRSGPVVGLGDGATAEEARAVAAAIQEDEELSDSD